MQNVNKVIGLLNEKAPTNHFLAYINPKEANLLKSMGGSGLVYMNGSTDYVEVFAQFNVTRALRNGTATQLQGFLIRTL